ncbi:GNAT family N-acetyltransferase [Streptomyces sp. GMY02]|uniref:GNAT family N-acetyltransferase n=1 Tax=Streptomyces sp. GMY02 TaxID=1333528 RepID=UPI001C2C066E|nr:GNAT family N-acetyltransferase [Streptomyces sp. GMY02]QXE37977.1 GNAT family N-acetyltransferase [Streptomyces sp. GMY02]
MASRVTRRNGARFGGEAVRIRRATARDAKRLTALVRRSRAYEGPYAPMITGYRVGPDYIEAHEVFVAVDSGERILGFYALVLPAAGSGRTTVPASVPAELDLMFVADDAQGLGLGRRLIEHLKGRAGEAGLDRVRIVSHPPAEGFYRSVGARRTGTEAANPPAVMWDRPELVLIIPRVVPRTVPEGIPGSSPVPRD